MTIHVSGPRHMLAERVGRKVVTEAGSISVNWVLIVEAIITHNQDVPGFDHVVLKEVLELTQKEANSRLISLNGGGRYITTTSFTVEEELSVTSMFSNDFVFHEYFDVIFIFDLCMMATPLRPLPR